MSANVVPPIETVIEELKKIDDPEKLQQMLIATLKDFKTTKDILLQLSEIFGLYKDGVFDENPKMKTIITAISGYTIKIMNPFAQAELAKEFAFLSNIVPIATKYQNL